MTTQKVTLGDNFCGYKPQTLVPAQYPQCGYGAFGTRSRLLRSREHQCCTVARPSGWAGTTRGLRAPAGTGKRAGSASARSFDLASSLFNTTLRVVAGSSGHLNEPYTYEKEGRRVLHALTHIGLGNPVLKPASTRNPFRVTARSNIGPVGRVVA